MILPHSLECPMPAIAYFTCCISCLSTPCYSTWKWMRLDATLFVKTGGQVLIEECAEQCQHGKQESALPVEWVKFTWTVDSSHLEHLATLGTQLDGQQHQHLLISHILLEKPKLPCPYKVCSTMYLAQTPLGMAQWAAWDTAVVKWL